jgi:hypothetical protein
LQLVDIEFFMAKNLIAGLDLEPRSASIEKTLPKESASIGHATQR